MAANYLVDQHSQTGTESCDILTMTSFDVTLYLSLPVAPRYLSLPLLQRWKKACVAPSLLSPPHKSLFTTLPDASYFTACVCTNPNWVISMHLRSCEDSGCRRRRCIKGAHSCRTIEHANAMNARVSCFSFSSSLPLRHDQHRWPSDLPLCAMPSHYFF